MICERIIITIYITSFSGEAIYRKVSKYDSQSRFNYNLYAYRLYHQICIRLKTYPRRGWRWIIHTIYTLFILYTWYSDIYRKYRVLYFYYLLTYIYLPIIKKAINLNIISFNRFFRSNFDPKHGNIIPSIFTDII